jgi:signal transduction histidine kinase/ActR/RegA family two-component response regulator
MSDGAAATRLDEPRDVNSTRPFTILLVAVIALPVLLFSVSSYLSYETFVQEARAQLERTLDAIHEHAAKVFETHELVFNQVDQMLGDMSDDEIRAHEAEIHNRLGTLDARLDQIDEIFLLGRDGHALASGQIYPVPATANYSDRDYVKVLRDGSLPSDAIYVGEIVTGRLLKRDFFIVDRRRGVYDGKADPFNGIVAIAIDPGYFRGFYAQIASAGTTIVLARSDGYILARSPELPGKERRLPANGSFMANVKKSPERGIYESTVSLDNTPRIAGYRRLQGYPVYVIAGIDKSEIASTWLTSISRHLIFGLPATLGLIALTALARRRMLRETRLLQELRIEVSRREETEEQLRQAQKMEAIGRLTGGLAHDFNNLMTIVTGSLDLLSRRLTTDEPRVKKLLDNAMEGARRASTLTRQLLAFARRQPLDPKPTDINRLVSEVSALLRGTLGETIAIETVLAGGLWPANIDAHQLERAIVNLALNSRDAMSGGGRLTIETANAHLDEAYAKTHAEVTPGQYTSVAITDTGSGIAPDIVSKIFEPFFTTKPAGHGTGLGLSQVFGFVKQSGGHVKVYSEAGKGTTVRLYLPRHLGQIADASASEDDAFPQPEAGGVSVLLVEDDADVRRFAADALVELGHRVKAMDNGESALACLMDGEYFDLLLTDVVMPGMDGRRLADAALKRRPDLKVLFMTGYTPNAIIHNGVLDPGTHLLSKPFAVTQLAEKLRIVLGDATADEKQ